MVRKNRYIRDSEEEEHAGTHPFWPPPLMLDVCPIKANEDGTIYHLLRNSLGEIVTLYELLEILAALKPFYDWMPDREILRQNETMRENRIAREQRHRTPRATETPTPEHGFVYVLQAGEFYKIGVSKHVDSRIKQLATLPPFDLELICTIETADMYGLEKVMHMRFDHVRVKGEWFELDSHDVDAIRAFAANRREVDDQ